MPIWFWILTVLVHVFTGVACIRVSRKRGGSPLLLGLSGLIGGISVLLVLLLYLRYKERKTS